MARFHFPRLLLILLSGLPSLLTAGPDGAEALAPLEWSRRMAGAEIARAEEAVARDPALRGKWDYAQSIVDLAMIALTNATGDMRYADFARTEIGAAITPEGTVPGARIEDYNLDMVRPGTTALALYEFTGDERYRKAADGLRLQLERQPRTHSGGFWHKLRYQHQMWLDGLYMAEPFYAQYTGWFGKPAAYDDIARQFRIVSRQTFDPATGLFRHAWDESKNMPWADKKTGKSPSFWGRSIGWFAMAYADTIGHIPAGHPARDEMIRGFRRVANGIVKHQDPRTGLWWQVTDQGGRGGNYLEATASCMFVYALAKGINEGWLPRGKFEPAARAGFAGIVRDLLRTGDDGRLNLIQCCRVAGLDAIGRDGTFEYYTGREQIVSNDAKGTGPFILAGIEMQKLCGPDATFAGGRKLLTGWDMAPEILSRISPPVFPKRDFPVTGYGAVAGGSKPATRAIARAIEACSKAGGGRVVVPKGKFLTGAVHLRSNVNLHLAAGAVLEFSTDPQDYPTVLTRYEGVEYMNYSPLIYAYGAQNVAVTGPGTIDGGAGESNWWRWARSPEGKGKSPSTPDRNKLFELGASEPLPRNRVFGPGHFLRPNLLQFYYCHNVLVEGVRILRSPMWEIHPVLCSNVTVRGVTIESDGPNNDGCNPESCRDVLIENCTFQTGDDCIAIKSGRNADGRRIGIPSENIIIRKCVMRDGHGGVTIGSEISGGCRNVFVEDCKMDSPRLDRALRIKTNAMRGGTIENIYARNIEVGEVADAVISINFRYEEGANGTFPPTVRNVFVENLTSRSSKHALELLGFEDNPIRNLQLTNCTFSGVRDGNRIEFVEGLEKSGVREEPASGATLAPAQTSP